MYYPIIDKLKEVMKEIGQGGGGGQLVIEGTVTSNTGGTWEGSFSDIESAFTNNTPVYFSAYSGGQKLLFTLVSNVLPGVLAYCIPVPRGSSYMVLNLNSDNTFGISAS